MTRILRCLFLLGAIPLSAPGYAWSDHASLVWPLLRSMPELMEPTLDVETLEDFINAEAEGLQQVLAAHELWAREHIEHYPPRPDVLAFTPDAGDRRAAFLEAIRVNPTLPYSNYLQVMVDEDAPADALTFESLSFLQPGIIQSVAVYRALNAGDRVAPAQVMASGSDEPDFGIDIGLFTNNNTEFGQRYGFEAQPFGDPKLEYGSQAPFHMGFYHLDWLTQKAQPDLLRSFPEWRVALFGELARFAFATGHDYWGWRFSGWALHYIGDLTQPYHAQPLPGLGTLSALWLVAQGKTDEAVQLVSNRHGVIESFQYQRLQAALNSEAWDGPLLQAIVNGGDAPPYVETSMRNGLSVESVDAGDALDAALEAFVPARYVDDPGFEWTGSGEEHRIVETLIAEGGQAALDGMDRILIEQLRRFSRYARAWVNATKAAAADG